MTRDEIAKNIGACIRSRRKARKETLLTVAARAGLALGFLSQIERGTSNASVNALHRISVAMDWSLSQLFVAVEATNPKGKK